jgi:hypothetical protein
MLTYSYFFINLFSVKLRDIPCSQTPVLGYRNIKTDKMCAFNAHTHIIFAKETPKTGISRRDI